MANRTINDFLQDIYDSEEGAHVAAFFDFDKTLIAGYSAQSFLTEQLKSGGLSPQNVAKQLRAAARFRSGKMNFSAFMAETSGMFRGQAEYVFEEFGEQVYRKKVAGAIYPEARKLLQAHRDMGHTIAIVSSATLYQIEPAARELGIDYIMCTDLEIENGIFTGNVISPTCFGDGKRNAAEQFSNEMDTHMSDSFFYTDSEDDLPLLEAVGHPRVVNPSKKLARIARERSYQVCKFTGGERPTISRVARTAGAYATLPMALGATAPLWALSGKKRDALNAGMSLWSDTVAALTGLTFEVEGEQHLWSHRPCVFIFNHQSSMDPIILGKLLRRDITGIGKQEIARFPVVGPAMKYADMVFIDRSSSEKAIEQIKPVITALREDNLSVCLAPEGTRSRGTKLGRFKSGAFHIAMQAKVPIVPIVIHNASDALPKGHNIAKPAHIRVTVLPPIKTGRWTPRTVKKHVVATRNKYLETLGQLDEHNN